MRTEKVIVNVLAVLTDTKTLARARRAGAPYIIRPDIFPVSLILLMEDELRWSLCPGAHKIFARWKQRP